VARLFARVFWALLFLVNDRGRGNLPWIAFALVVPAEEDQGYAFAMAQLPQAASLERTEAFCLQVEELFEKNARRKILHNCRGLQSVEPVQATYNAFFFVTLSRGENEKNLRRNT